MSSIDELRQNLRGFRPRIQEPPPPPAPAPRQQTLYNPADLNNEPLHRPRRIEVRELAPAPAPAPVSVEVEPALNFKLSQGSHTPICVLHGPGGTGKTYRIRQYQAEHESENVFMTATTGVAAINIGPGCQTINSAFKFFNEDSLPEAIEKRGRQIQEQIRNVDILVIDEISMMSARTLELLYNFIDRFNSTESEPVKLVLSGDFCQLPPITRQSFGKRNEEIPFAFKSATWKRFFEPAMQRLTVNYRQANDPDFQRALQAARRGEPAQCVAALHGKINFAQFVDMGFPGLTLYGVNDDVASHNNAKLKAIDSPLIKDEADLWGEKPLTEWKDILQPTYVKVGAQVRVTANQTPGFAYVNGDIATLLEYNPGQFAIVELHRGERTQVMVNKVTRLNLRGLHYGEEPPTNCNGMEVPKEWTEPEDRSKYQAYIAHCMSQRRAFYDPKTRKWVIGAITYVPIALGWASTFHKAQGLTADMLQIDISNQFSGQPQMMYVALSRCRKASNITITRGDPAKLVSRIRHHPDTKPYM